MSFKIEKIILFTNSACPLGRTMKDVLNDIEKLFPSIHVNKVFIDQDPSTTNRFGINKNPTTLFLNREERELTRVEGFKETSEIIKLIEHGNFEKHLLVNHSDNPIINEEKYTIFLIKEQKLQPVEIIYENPTNVSTPRITAVNMLLTTERAGYVNPFSRDSKLNLIEFEGCLAKVYLSDTALMDEENNRNREACLLGTLQLFGITKVKLL